MCCRCPSQALPLSLVQPVAQFLIAKGLSDRSADVCAAALASGRDLMQQYGQDGLSFLLPMLEVRSLFTLCCCVLIRNSLSCFLLSVSFSAGLFA